MNDTPTTHPIPLRIRFKKKRRYSDEYFMQVDEAIDAVGRELFPSSWGMSEIWREAPFLYLSKTHRLKRLKFHSRKKLGRLSFGGGYFKDECKSERTDAQSCSDEIKVAYARLRSAIENGNLKCDKLTKTNGIMPFTKKDLERLRQQQDVVLYSGRIKGSRNGVHIIQFQRESLSEWVRRGCPSGPLIAAPRCLYLEIAALITSSTNLPRIMSRKALTECTRLKFSLSGYRLSKEHFDNIVWNKVPENYKKPGRKGGNTDSEQLSAWESFKRQIEEKAEFCRKRSRRGGY